MPKWEYAQVIVGLDIAELERNKADVMIYRYDEKHRHEFGPFGKIMGWMGGEGWELVSVTHAPLVDALIPRPKMLYTFKREAKQ